MLDLSRTPRLPLGIIATMAGIWLTGLLLDQLLMRLGLPIPGMYSFPRVATFVLQLLPGVLVARLAANLVGAPADALPLVRRTLLAQVVVTLLAARVIPLLLAPGLHFLEVLQYGMPLLWRSLAYGAGIVAALAHHALLAAPKLATLDGGAPPASAPPAPGVAVPPGLPGAGLVGFVPPAAPAPTPRGFGPLGVAHPGALTPGGPATVPEGLPGAGLGGFSPPRPAGAASAPPAPVAAGPIPIRSVAEEHLWLELHPCACGSTEKPPRVGVVQDGGDLVSRFDGPCPACRSPRRLDFTVPELPLVQPPRFGHPGAASRCIDAGQWIALCGKWASQVPADTSKLDPQTRARLKQTLEKAVIALEEVLAFIPPGQTAVPDAGFFTPQGQAVAAAGRGQFDKARLEARLGALRQGLASM